MGFCLGRGVQLAILLDCSIDHYQSGNYGLEEGYYCCSFSVLVLR